MATINNKIYDEVSDTWWEQDGFMAVLRTSINPPRFDYFHKILVDRLKLNPQALQVLDVGCGGGLLAEQFASLGCEVTGIDQSVPSLNAAKAHATKSGLNIRYIESVGETLPFEAAKFDIVCCCDVLEHVDDIDTIIAEISRVLKPGGVLFFDTINRTVKSNLVAIKMAQDWRLTRFLPKNVHVWDKFIKPNELFVSLVKNGLPQAEIAGLSPAHNPLKSLLAITQQKLGYINFAELGSKLKLKQSKDISISYMGFAVRSLMT
ncbi:MAG TPA: bifunctional 2-polyprenyl-6-hydroxyphenol methylase/3-demethylubiquinol 3-O-methyltransferase UbiG [Methylotenera sp.]|nr:bifunctional 2-polyprenyl-6-hydroxyphenol methylase/3-demethylubiquinol 3-O-methyltransferase UbiG [Methylotenera sp.]